MTLESYLGGLSEALALLPTQQLDPVLRCFEEALDSRRRLFTLGNGGSAMTASHIVCDFQKGLCGPGGCGLRAVALTDSLSLITAWANDADYTQVFARQLEALGEPGDLVLAISGSGNSPNVLRAVEYGNRAGMVTIGLSGFDGGKLKDLARHSVVVPCRNMQQVEDVHMVLCHWIFTHLMRRTAGAQGAG